MPLRRDGAGAGARSRACRARARTARPVAHPQRPGSCHGVRAAAGVVLRRAGERNRLATIAALLARLLYALGRFDESQRYSMISEDAASDEDVASQVLWRGTRGKILARAGDIHGAEGMASGAV